MVVVRTWQSLTVTVIITQRSNIFRRPDHLCSRSSTESIHPLPVIAFNRIAFFGLRFFSQRQYRMIFPKLFSNSSNVQTGEEIRFFLSQVVRRCCSYSNGTHIAAGLRRNLSMRLGMIHEKHSVLDRCLYVLRGLECNASIIGASAIFCNFEVARQFRK